MDEWGVVLVLVTLIGLAISIAKPIVTLTKSITTLTVEVNGLRKDLAKQEKDVHASFTKVWDHNKEQDDELSDHEARIRVLEHTEE